MTQSSFLDRFGHSIRNRHVALFDLLLLPMAAGLAFALRLDSSQLQAHSRALLVYALAAPLIKMPLFSLMGLYSRFWHYASTDEMVLLAGAAVLGGLVQGALFLGSTALLPDMVPAVPRSIPLIDILLTGIVIAAPRFALRMWAQSARRSAKGGAAPGLLEHVLIAGAGEAGAMVLRELRANPQTGLIPVGFVDDDPSKHGMLIQRTRVLGSCDALPELVRQHHVAQVIIAMPSASGQAVRKLVTACDAAGVRARIIPGIYELLDGTVRINQLRDVQIEDLLRRAPVRTDTAQVAALLAGKRVLVTGAGGSIGSELCRQIARFGPSELVLLGHGENSIFDIYNELEIEDSRSKMNPTDLQSSVFNLQSRLIPVIADVRDAGRLAAVFARYRPEVVFHAAAHKHVPLMEGNVEDAISNNVLGARSLVSACVGAGAGRLVLISTDKAVNAVSVMGETKRVAELIVQDAARSTGRPFVAVRFGNVLGSRGSVVPFFQKQIAAGGPVTVTHPEMSRYFMTIPEAVQLVLQAAALGRGGEIFVLDMGEPVRIVDLASDLIRLSGLEPGRDIEIRFTGVRPGEKLNEELFAGDEPYGRTAHEKIFVCSDGGAPAGEAATGLAGRLDALAAAAGRGDAAEARRLLQELAHAGRARPDGEQAS